MITAIAILASLILLTYVIYPAFVLAAGGRAGREHGPVDPFNGNVYVFIAARNEGSVIGATLESLERSDFSPGRLVCYIGSDASDDGTDDVVRQAMDRGSLDIRFRRFDVRQGKPSIINQLVEAAHAEHTVDPGDLFLLMDANIRLARDFISELAGAFSDPRVGIADGIASATSGGKDRGPGMAESERKYLAVESRLKLAESRLWGCAMGPFGGAYMIRPALFTPVPGNFLVDDFFIFFNILRRGYRSVVVPSARCTEPVSGDLGTEFRRKSRISAGNFQNTAHFLPEIMKLWKGRNLVFWLHKLLRWLSPILALTIMVLLGILAAGNPLAGQVLLIMICLLVGPPLMNYLFKGLNLNLQWLQGLSYLIIMNLALLAGLLKFLKGVRTNVWEPTQRSA